MARLIAGDYIVEHRPNASDFLQNGLKILHQAECRLFAELSYAHQVRRPGAGAAVRNPLTRGPRFDNQTGVSGPVERMGVAEDKPADTSSPPDERARPVRSRNSLVAVILAFGFVVVAIILAGTYAYHRALRTPQEIATDLAHQISSGIKEMFNMTPRVTVNQVLVIHESYPSFELATVTRETTATYEYRNQWLGSQKAITIKGRFRIKAGFDLSQSSALEVQPNPLRIVAQFPNPKILSVEMLSQEIEKSENGYWNRLKPEDQKEALDELMRTARAQGGTGIQTEAKKNLEEKLRSLADQKKAPIEFQYGFKK